VRSYSDPSDGCQAAIGDNCLSQLKTIHFRHERPLHHRTISNLLERARHRDTSASIWHIGNRRKYRPVMCMQRNQQTAMSPACVDHTLPTCRKRCSGSGLGECLDVAARRGLLKEKLQPQERHALCRADYSPAYSASRKFLACLCRRLSNAPKKCRTRCLYGNATWVKLSCHNASRAYTKFRRVLPAKGSVITIGDRQKPPITRCSSNNEKV
jgi:hypothetical protein